MAHASRAPCSTALPVSQLSPRSAPLPCQAHLRDLSAAARRRQRPQHERSGVQQPLHRREEGRAQQLHFADLIDDVEAHAWLRR